MLIKERVMIEGAEKRGTFAATENLPVGCP